MAMPRKQSKEASNLDKEISRLFQENCKGIQIPMMEIPNIYSHARAVYASNGGNIEDMRIAIVDYVNIIRKN